MKRLYLIITALAILLLSGCGIFGTRVRTLKGWTFQYNEDTNDYSLFFGLCDKSGKYIAANAEVEIRIVNDDGRTVYEDVISITKNDFGFYTNKIAGERYLANITIDEDDIWDGTTSNGTVYFTVTDNKTFSFDECSCDAWNCLPVKKIKLVTDSLPVELQKKGYGGTTEAKYTVTKVNYDVDNSLGSSTMTIEICGKKTYGQGGSYSYDIISYKLYDSDGYLVDSGHVYIGTSLDVGDKFKDDSLIIFDLTPGETYTLQLLDYNW